MRARIAATGLGSLLLVSVAGGVADQAAPVGFPEGYRSWTHTKSMVIQERHFLAPKFVGIHHIYANQKALAALKARTPCPDGAVFVFDVLAAQPDANAILEGPRQLVAVMEKDGTRFAKTGGWGYEVFKGETRERGVTDGGAACHACHRSRRSHDYVFHEWRP
jgi:hypothetical protein